MKSKLILSFFLLLSAFFVSLNSAVIDDFDYDNTYINNNFTTDGDNNASISLSSDKFEYYAGSASLKITAKNISGSTYNYLRKNFNDVSSLKNKQYITLWVKGDGGSANFILNLYDDESWWNVDFSITGYQVWKQLIIPFKSLGTGNPYGAPGGFTHPSWDASGDGVLTSDNFQYYEIRFNAADSIINIDNFEAVNSIEDSFPVNNAVVDFNLSAIEINFGVKMDTNSLTNIELYKDGIEQAISYIKYNDGKNISIIPASDIINDGEYKIHFDSGISFHSDAVTSGSFSPFSAATDMIFYKGNRAIGSSGGVLQLSDRTYISIPANALTKEFLFSCSKVSQDAKDNIFSDKIYSISPAAVFNKTASIRIYYEDFRENDDLKIFQYKNSDYILIGGLINKENNYVEANISESGIFALGIASVSDIENLITDVEEQNNPVTPNSDGKNDSVKIKFNLVKDNTLIWIYIYDRYGNLIKRIYESESLSQGAHILEWDGKADISNQIVGQGIYICVIKAQDKDSGRIEKVSSPIVVVK